MSGLNEWRPNEWFEWRPNEWFGWMTPKWMVWMNDAQMNGLAVVKKVPSQWKNFFWKKIPSSLLLKRRSSKWSAEFFMKLTGPEIFNFWWFHGSEKFFFTTKLLIKHERQKIKKILHTVLEKIISQNISQNICKIGLTEADLGLLEHPRWSALW